MRVGELAPPQRIQAEVRPAGAPEPLGPAARAGC
jgi:hypothetical protein